MSAALPELVAAYTKKTGQTVKLSFGASGNLTNQIRNGAPFDVFFSADEEYPQQLIAEGLASKDYALSLRGRTAGAVGAERFATGLIEAWHQGFARSFGQEDFDRESCDRTVRSSGGGRAATFRNLRSGL